MKRRLLLSAAALAIAVAQAAAQSPPSPALFFGFVPTAGQWNSYFQQKADYPGILGNPNVWTSLQTFNAGVQVTGNSSVTGNLTVSGTLSGAVAFTAPQFEFLIGNGLGQAAATTLAGDCTYGGSGIVCTKTNGTSFGTAATQNTGTSGATIPFNNGSNTLSGSNTFSGLVNFTSTFQISGNAVTWPGSATTVAALNIAGQTLTGGATVTAGNLGTVSSGTLTINCGTVPLQFFTNNGAFTLAAPASDSSCMVLMTNGASAGAVSFSGFTVGSSTGDALTTTNTQKFSFSIWRINSVAGYRVAAHQ